MCVFDVNDQMAHLVSSCDHSCLAPSITALLMQAHCLKSAYDVFKCIPFKLEADANFTWADEQTSLLSGLFAVTKLAVTKLAVTR